MIGVAVVAGGLGAVLRWLLSRWNNDWPSGTLIANLGGSLALGLLVGLDLDPDVALVVGGGLLGGLTTFSTFAVEITERPAGPALRYLAASSLGGLAMAAVGLALGLAAT